MKPNALRNERSQLTIEEIVQAAMELLAKNGIDRLTIRALAKRLGVVPGAIYYYVEGKEELLERIAQTIFNAVPLSPPGTWQEQLSDHVKATVRTFSKFPGANALAGSAEPWRWSEGKVTPIQIMLTKAGFAGEELQKALMTATIFMSGAIRLTDVLRDRDEPSFAASPDFDAAVDTLIAGLAARVRILRRR
jgi:AcrR family transcriptional regulator